MTRSPASSTSGRGSFNLSLQIVDSVFSNRAECMYKIGAKMLTESERKWLRHRKERTCLYCPTIPQSMCAMGERPYRCAIDDVDWKDAAEFSERVAEKLAEHQQDRCVKNNGFCINLTDYHTCQFCRLKYARLAVEEEMDGQA